MTHHTIAKRRGFKLFTYIGDIVSELKKVVWLSRREVTYLTALVLVVSLVAGIILGSIDFGFAALVDKFLLGN